MARPHALLALALAACAARFTGEPARPELSGCAAPPQPARRPGLIGVVADSQFNTLNAAGWNLWRRGPSDWLVDVAIRPPALEGSPSQVTWLVDHAEPDAGVRVILSHYDVATINAGDDRGPYHDRLRPLVRDRRTLWLTAHTHWPELRTADHRFGRRDQRVVALETNLGSSTDYPAYGLLTDITDDRRAATFLGETQVFAITPERCEPVLSDMSRVIAGSDYFPFRRHTRGLGLFGLDFLVDFTLVKKEYRHRSWSADDDRHVRENIRTWLAAYAPGAAEGRQCGWPDDAHLTAGACVAFYASLQEGVKHGWAPVTCDDCRPERRPAPRVVPPLGGFRLRFAPARE